MKPIPIDLTTLDIPAGKSLPEKSHPIFDFPNPHDYRLPIMAELPTLFTTLQHELADLERRLLELLTENKREQQLIAQKLQLLTNKVERHGR